MWQSLGGSISYDVHDLKDVRWFAKEKERRWLWTFMAAKRGEPLPMPVVYVYAGKPMLVNGDVVLMVSRALGAHPMVLLANG
jgi:hypothetical protein